MNKKSIKSVKGSEVLLFLFFVLVSCCLWLMLTLNQTYETDIDFSVHVKNIPQDAGFSSSSADDGDILTVRVRDRGTTLMNYKFEPFVPLIVDYSELRNRKGRLTLPVSALRKRIEGQLLSSTSLLSFNPDTLSYYTRESALLFPVRVNCTVEAARQYAVGDITVTPDSVLVFASAAVTDTLRYIPTEYFEQGGLRDTLMLDVPLIVGANVECVPSRVRVTVPVAPYAEKSFDVPVQGVGFPSHYTLRAFPSRVKVVMNVGLDVFEQVKADDFKVVVDYSEIENDTLQRARLHLVESPSCVRNVRIVPSEIEYLIERNE